MKLLFIGPNLGAGGAERQWSILLTGLRDRGHDVRLIALDGGGPLAEPLARRGVPLEIIGMRQRTDIRPLLSSATLRRFDPDVVVSRGVNGLYVGHAVARLRRSRHAFNDHRQVGLVLSRRREKMVSLLGKRLDVVITVTPGQAQAWTARGYPAERVIVVRNGVPLPSVAQSKQEIRGELGIPESAVLAVLVASMRPVKRIQDFVAAVQMARHRRPDLIGAVVGEGPERLTIERAISDPAAVRLLGHRDDVPRILKAADMFALTSEYEAAPMAILEAMAAALPVIATSVGGVAEIVADGDSGLLVPAGDPGAMAGALSRLAGDAELREAMGRLGAHRHRDQWGAEAMIDRYAEVLEAAASPTAR